MIHPIKWLFDQSRLAGLFNWVKWNLVASFLGTFLIPLLYLLNILIAFKTSGSFPTNISLIILGILIGALGLLIWIISYINLGKSFGVLPQKQKRIKRGIYKYFNHPMYIGIYLSFLGLSIAYASWPGLLFLDIIIAPLLFIRAVLEDKKLTD